GRPLATERLVHERLGKPTALAVFASDNLSSSAYATEEILRVLLLGGLGMAAFRLVLPLTLALLAVLGVLLFSYRQTIKAYPQAGGAYLVTRDNFGLLPAQIAGVALLTDYILTVSVSVSAGTAALTSLYGPLFPYRVWISVGFIALIALGNLRGVRESGRLFAVPTYFFIGMMAILIGTGVWRLLAGTLPTHAGRFPLHPEEAATAPPGFAYVWLLLRAFASGGAAVTGVEAISNGVPAFRPPEWRNARTTLMWMGGILGTLFLFLSLFAARMHITVDPGEKVTVVAQIGRVVFGSHGPGTALFAALQVATLLILVLAANTSFADFPRLASFVAQDRFLPTWLTRHGDRLVFSNGIVALAILSSVLVILFDASVSRLIPLYAIGVFTTFTFSQLGMAKRHLVLREPGWRAGLAINGLGGVVTAVVTVIIASVKFTHGAWIVLVSLPLVLAGLLRIHRYYGEVEVSLRDPGRRGPVRDLPRQRVVIPVGTPGPEDVYAVAYAQRLFPLDVRLVHFAEPGTAIGPIVDAWGDLGQVLELRLQRHGLPTEIRDLARELRATAEREALINVIIPETVRHLGWRHLLRAWRVQRIKAALVGEAGVVVTNVAHHAGYEALEPVGGASAQGWRHVAVVLVGGVHNATARALRYAWSLRADEVRCLHVDTDHERAERVREEWAQLHADLPLEVLPSPYRQVAGPIHAWVRAILEEHPRTFVTIVLPEFVVRKRWHRFLHNQTALTLKGTFLFEPSVVVSAVPYRL
ncbi:MAG TPA: APC family permease, partial [Actinomycetota bacterium]|nr:APC family permease [Actinomycetota bacterium]